MIWVEEVTTIECDKCGDSIYKGEDVYVFKVKCKCGEHRIIRLCQECVEAAREVNV